MSALRNGSGTSSKRSSTARLETVDAGFERLGGHMQRPGKDLVNLPPRLLVRHSLNQGEPAGEALPLRRPGDLSSWV